MKHLDCDFLIIGAGSAGCVLANRLSENPQNRVVLLEAGGPDSDPLLHVPVVLARSLTLRAISWGYYSEPEAGLGGRKIPLYRGKVLGGTSTINGMVYTRGHPHDYDRWQREGCDGWAYADVLPFFRKAEGSERGSSEFHGADGPLRVSVGRPIPAICNAFLAAAQAEGFPTHVDSNAEPHEGFGHYDANVYHGWRYSTASAYLKAARSRPNLTVLIRCEASRLLFEGERVIGAEAIQRGEALRIEAGAETVLSGGAFNSPKLLMLSGIGPAERLRELGIPVRLDRPAIGQNLQDHLTYRMSFSCTQPVTAYAHTRPIRGMKAILEYLLCRTGIVSNIPIPTGGFFRSDESLEIPDMQASCAIGIVPERGKLLPPREGFTVVVRQGRPRSRGVLSLRSADAKDSPIIAPRYFSDSEDMPTLIRGVRRLRNIVQNHKVAQFIGEELFPGRSVANDDETLAASIRETAGTTHHFIGTCRMGDDSEAVVDSQLRVRGVKALRVVDASIMPSHINGNTNAPTIMIAEKGASMILGAQ